MSAFLTTKQAAEVLNVQPLRVRTLCREGRIPATKLGHIWIIARENLDEFAKVPRKRGWQEGKERKVTQAKIVDTRANARERRMSLRMGQKGTGRVVQSVLYWPESPRSVDKAYEILVDEAARLELEIVPGDDEV